MARRGKRYQNALKKIDKTRYYGVSEGMNLLKNISGCKFDETMEVAVRLGIDSRKADQQVRSSVKLPHGVGRSIRVIVFAKSEKAKEAEAAGADEVGGEDLIKKVMDGFLEFDAAISTPDLMREVGKLGRILGPRGLMPNPKSGTVTFDVFDAVRDIKAGRLEFRADKYGIVHLPIGKVSFSLEHLMENLREVLWAIVQAKPSASRGQYLRSVTISSTMGPGIKLNLKDIKTFMEK
jgi:large subunit ribosomal protein L1